MLVELIRLRNHWEMLRSNNPQVAPIFQHCINDVDNLIGELTRDKLEGPLDSQGNSLDNVEKDFL